MPSETPRRNSLAVWADRHERAWSLGGWGLGISLINSGSTGDLVEAARAAQAFRTGMPMREMRAAWPFLKLSYLAEATDLGAAAVVAAQWKALLSYDDGWPEYHQMIAAAHAEPKLRQLYPYTSMWTLRFSTTTGSRFSPDVACLDAPRGTGTFKVRGTYNPGDRNSILAETATAAEAAALAAARIPDDLGPAVEGPYPHPA